MDFNRVINGMIRAVRLDRAFYKEVEADTSYTQDAWAVVILVSLISALGQFLGALVGGAGVGRAILSFVWGAVWGVIGFYIWVMLVTYIGTRMFKGTGDAGEVQRTLGFAYSPQVLGILGIIPCLGWIAALAGWIWSLVAGYIAIKEALDQDDTNAILTIVVSGIIVMVAGAIIGGVIGIGSAVTAGILGG